MIAAYGYLGDIEKANALVRMYNYMIEYIIFGLAAGGHFQLLEEILQNNP